MPKIKSKNDGSGSSFYNFMREREIDLAFSYKYNKARMINGDTKFLFSDHPHGIIFMQTYFLDHIYKTSFT